MAAAPRHDFLALMLGVRRAGVSVALDTLESQGLVGRMIEFFIARSTRRIHHAANAITLKHYPTERALLV